MSSIYLEPNYIQKFNIYDIFYNDDNKLIIICPSERNSYIINYISFDNKILTFDLYKCPHNHTYIYSLDVEYSKNIKLSIDNNIIETYVNKYPIFKDEIIFSTIVKNEDDYIRQWIDFHLSIGISKFIIYDNSNENTLAEVLNEYIKNKIVILIKWIYPYILPVSGISGQTTQQNHSIYAFRLSKYIGLFDIDEYINMQKNKNINSFFEELIKLENIDIDKISSFCLLNKFFYNPNNLPTKGNMFLKIFNCDEILKFGQEKCFVIPKNVNTYSVHGVTNGKPIYNVNEKYIYFNHYYFLNKTSRGKNQTKLTDDSILLHLKN
jgi:hypothetical protein